MICDYALLTQQYISLLHYIALQEVSRATFMLVPIFSRRAPKMMIYTRKYHILGII